MVKPSRAPGLWRALWLLGAGSALVGGLLVSPTPATATGSPTSSSTTSTTSTTTTTTTLPGTTTTTTTTLPGTTTTTVPTTTTTTPPSVTWPQRGSAAIIVPQLSVEASSPNQPRVPIASLTKMMTAWVVLHRLPLVAGESGPCMTVNAADVAIYNHDIDNDLSSVKIVAGINLCENVLLRGMLVHSAADYAQLLVVLTGMHEATYVAAMNQAARSLGLRNTGYVDVTGLSAGDRSTAQDQATLAADLMTDEPVVQGIVDLPEVSLPVAGVVESYTPFVGQSNIVGVKSGFTTAAGGCDVMAAQDNFISSVITTYAVVLGEHGANPVGTAGLDALSLSRSVRSLIARVRTPTGVEVEWIGSSNDVVAALSH